MNDIIISEKEIEHAEKILLGNGNIFDRDEKFPIISCMDESIEVIACPGSGKTTTLLAKLCILSDKMPFEDKKGVAIITHTNVAVEEITKKLGFKSEIFFNYPNFFGTIHSFVNKYLAIPMYKEMFNSNINFINDDLYYSKLLSNVVPYGKIDKYVYGRVRALNKETPLSTKELNLNKKIFLCSINMNIENGNIVFMKEKKVISRDPNSDLYKELYLLFFDKLLKQGYLKYADSYLLAKLYIKKYPDLNKFFSERFKYLFIDETQDNSVSQDDIIESLFSDSKTIIQRFGDPNQGIYESRSIRSQSSKGSLKTFEISKSMRYSSSIANFISPLRIINGNSKLIGNSSIENIPPHIIMFDIKKILQVKDKFVELINHYNLSGDVYPFKAIGWVGYNKNPERLTIESYFPQYISQKKLNSKIQSHNFHYILKQNTIRKRTVGNVYKSVLDFLVGYFMFYEEHLINQNLSKSLFEKYFKECYVTEFTNLRIIISKWAKLIFSSDKKVYSEIRDYLKEILKLFMDETKINYDDFEALFLVGEESNTEGYATSNDYLKDGISIKTDTIHGVKGETHTATLYLQTFYKINDIKRIIDFILKKNKKRLSDEEVKSLKMAYVGMSRAKQLLCIAIESNCLNKVEIDGLIKMEENGDIKIVRI